MLKTIILNEINQNLKSLKLQVTFIIILVVFIVGSVAYVFQYRDALEDYNNYSSKMLEEIRKDADASITQVAVNKREYLLAPRNNGFIDDPKFQFTPNDI